MKPALFASLSLILGLTSGFVRAQSTTTRPAAALEATPRSITGSDAHIYRDVKPDPLRLFVFKPEGWKPDDRRPAFVFFFGGGWNRGTPERSAGWARMAAKWGLVGLAPDYRTRDRFGTTAKESVSDARAAVRWIQDHAAELGIDPSRVVVGFTQQMPEWREKAQTAIRVFLEQRQLIPDAKSTGP